VLRNFGTLKDAAVVLLVEGQELTRGRADLGEDEAEAPDLLLGLETELTAELELSVDALLLVGTTGRIASGAICKSTLSEENSQGSNKFKRTYSCEGQQCAACFTGKEL